MRTADVAAVAQVLGLRTVRSSGWDGGVDGARDGLFAAALGPVVVAVGHDAWHRGELDAIGDALRRLSASLGDAAWFGIDRDSGCLGWALARGGDLERAFCFDGGAHAVLWDEGEVTAAERRLGFFVDDPRDRTDDAIKWWPVAGDVHRLAAVWGIDPLRPPPPRGNGLLGRW